MKPREPSASLLALLQSSGLATASWPDIRLEPLSGGYRNVAYRWIGWNAIADAVVKVLVDAPSNPLYPTLPDHEIAALLLLRNRGIAPTLLWHGSSSDVGPVLVYEMVPGEAWVRGTEPVGELLAKAHHVDVTTSEFAFRRLPMTPDELRSHAYAIAELINDRPLLSLIREMIDSTYALAASSPFVPVSPALVHTDGGPGNIIAGADPSELRLIDWQCPGLGDPVEDLAVFSSPAIQLLYDRPPLSADDERALLTGYRRVAVETASSAALSAVERYPARAPLYHARISAYCAYRTEELASSDPATSARYAAALAADFASSHH